MPGPRPGPRALVFRTPAGRTCAAPGKGLPDGRFPERSRPLPTWRGLDPSAGFALPHTPTGGYGIRPYGIGVDAPHRPGKLFPVSVGAGHARTAAWTASTRFSVHLRAAHMRPLHARRRGRGCCAESARSGQDRSLHGTRERRIVGRGLDPSGQPVSAAR